MKTLPIAGFSALLAASGCTTPTERVVVIEHAAAPRPLPPPPAPQVMVAPPNDANGQQVMVGNMSEARRRELLLPSINPIEPFTPAPPPSPPNEYVPSESHHSGAPASYDHRPDGYDVLADVARIGLFTAAGAIIGHQWDDKGKGAAIGGGIALLTTPWLWGGGWR